MIKNYDAFHIDGSSHIFTLKGTQVYSIQSIARHAWNSMSKEAQMVKRYSFERHCFKYSL